MVDRDPHEGTQEMAVARPKAGAPDATAPAVVPRLGALGLLVVRRQVPPLLKRLTDAAKVAHLPGVGPGRAKVELKRRGGVTGAAPATAAARPDIPAAAGVAPNGQTVTARVAVAPGPLEPGLVRVGPATGGLAEVARRVLGALAPHNVGRRARARGGDAAT